MSYWEPRLVMDVPGQGSAPGRVKTVHMLHTAGGDWKDKHLGFDEPVEVFLSIDARGQVMVRLRGKSGQQLEASARDIAAGVPPRQSEADSGTTEDAGVPSGRSEADSDTPED